MSKGRNVVNPTKLLKDSSFQWSGAVNPSQVPQIVISILFLASKKRFRLLSDRFECRLNPEATVEADPAETELPDLILLGNIFIPGMQHNSLSTHVQTSSNKKVLSLSRAYTLRLFTVHDTQWLVTTHNADQTAEQFAGVRSRDSPVPDLIREAGEFQRVSKIVIRTYK